MQADNGLDCDLSEASASDLLLVEQPGGRVLHVGGQPLGVVSLDHAVRDSFVQLATYFPWIAPLLEAAIIGGKDDEGGARLAAVVTPWGDELAGEYADAAQHRAYVDHIKATIAARHPWFWSLLDNGRATVLMAPAGFTFAVPTQPGAQYDIPDFQPLMTLEFVGAGSAVVH